MNIWLIGIIWMLVNLFLCAISVLRGNIMNRLVALQFSGIVATLIMLLLAELYGRSIYFDVPLTMAILTYANLLVYLRFLERWL
ncbi:multiple resistance and pH regulation protein F [Legionella oakridgensis ATCC 33761 = DSM 21215]|uniref:Multiple resistance and pH regulation protein F n=3 Tax=Legionella oakridgensis TaxID=29423 RepID=W0BF27_9GAMM|nr:multiple resistance and pH regulation protein F [Legionella oakridgensis ATCC 33761 = DSM 21215]ETO93195.1 multiple resistance and pH regulation protein F [Legionella oakridgensis RV-2-2007]KTD37970.1 putative monovalent cation/H+ antiporter subunit F [Legionella oakridgensis]STY20309.1 putative monovalent cation/H+ antiporter subunit F [Legionella longbeachae]